MKRRIAVILLVIVGCVGLLYAILLSLGSQRDIYSDRSEGCIGMLPVRRVNPIFVEVVPGVQFRLDSGSDLSTITEEDLDKLRKMGCQVKTSIYPALGRDGQGVYRANIKRYTVSLPLHIYTFTTDTLGFKHEQLVKSTHNVLHNVDFVPSESGFSTLGIDLLENFRVDFQYENGVIALYFTRPDGYQDLATLKADSSPSKSIWIGNRYYMDIKIDRQTDSYFLDTDLQYQQIKLPENQRRRSKRHISKAIARTTLHTYEAIVDNDAWMEVGNRAGGVSAYYYDSREEQYSFNPLNMFQQDILIDYPGKVLALRPFCVLPKRHFSERPDTTDIVTPGI